MSGINLIVTQTIPLAVRDGAFLTSYSPSPNAAYSVVFKYYLDFTVITAHDDTTRIPAAFDSILVSGALYHMYLFKDNVESAQAAFLTFQEGLKNLQTIYINNYASITDTRIKF